MYSPGKQAVLAAKTYWYDELDRPGASQMQHARRLMESRPFLSRIPDQGLLSSAGTGAEHMQATRSSDGSYAFVYFPQETIAKTIMMSALSGERINAWWYNPRTGTCHNQSGGPTGQPFDNFAKVAQKSFDPPGSNASLDWVLVLDDAGREFPAPGSQPYDEANDTTAAA